MLLTAHKFIAGRNIQPITTITLSGSSNSGFNKNFTNCSVNSDPTNIINTTNPVLTPNENNPGFLELNPGTYSIRVKSMQIQSYYTPVNATLDGTIYIRVARLLNIVESGNTSAGDSLFTGQFVDDNSENETLGGGNLGTWAFEQFTASGTATYGQASFNQTATMPFIFIRNMPVSQDNATRKQSGLNNDDTAMAIWGFADAPNSGGTFSATITLEIVRGYDFISPVGAIT